MASASAPEMRGEWSIVAESGGESLAGTAIIDKEANAQGEFESLSVNVMNVDTGTFSGTLEGATATVKFTIAPIGPYEGVEFSSKTLTVEAGVSSLALSGGGTVTLEKGGQKSGTMVATRIRTYKQIEEQETKEREELEEKEAQQNVRGEWSLTLEAGPEKFKGVALITQEANAENKFASQSALFEGLLGGTFTGTLEHGEASVTITTEGDQAMSIPPGSFTSGKISVSSASNPTYMSGQGMFTVDGTEIPGTLAATRIKSYQQIEEQEIKEREAKAKLEEEALIAKEKVEREATEKAELELKEKRAREAREATEKANKNIQPPPSILPPPPALVPVALATRTLTVAQSGALSLKLTNPNSSPASGHLKVTFTSKVASAKHGGHAVSKTVTLGEASFSVAGDGTEVVKITLSRGARTKLAHLKTMHALVTLTTQATGQPAVTKTYSLTLHSGSAQHKG